LISLSPGHPHQQLIDRHLAKAGVKVRIAPIVNLLDTQIALVEAKKGSPSFPHSECRFAVTGVITTSQLINPVVRFDFHMISRRGRELPPERKSSRPSSRATLPPGRGAQACSELDGGPCRDRTYDQLIKKSFLARALLPSKTSTYASQVVPRFVDLRIDKALGALLGGFSNGTVVYRYELSLSNLQPADRMCIN
jgi:hypothetical protein